MEESFIVITEVASEAPAKVNLFLRLCHKRTDGFREIETLFQSISLADEVRVALLDTEDMEAGVGASVSSDGLGPWISLVVDGPDLGPTESNLAFRAARGFQVRTGFDSPIQIRLKKHIPAGAGLGGGSSDAAAVLRCLAALAGFVDWQELRAVACELGSDVPFFLGDSPLALGRGRGESLTPLRALPERHVVLALPQVHVSTQAAYEALTREREQAGSEDLAGTGHTTGERLPRADDGTKIFDLDSDLDWNRVATLAQNDFESIVGSAHPEIGVSLRGLRSEGATVALLSGSGSASFGLFADKALAQAAAAVLSKRHGWPFLCVQTRTDQPQPFPGGS